MDISVVVPVYGCPEALPQLHERLAKTLAFMGKSYEIIFVNDSCPRDSWSVIEQICAGDKNVVGIEMSRNFGQIKAILAGLDYSTGDWVVVMDCDLQDQPEEIARLYDKAIEGFDVVIARRAVRHDTFMKILVSKIFYKIYSLATDVNYDPALCNFSIVKRKVVDEYCKMREMHRAYVMYLQWLGFRQAILDVNHQDRYAGVSGYNFKKRMRMAEEILTSQSDKLLKLLAKLGVGITGLSFLYIIVLIVRYFTVHITPGYSSTIAVILMMGGLLTSSIGLVGIYIGNIFMEVKHRPLYVVRSILNDKSEE
ncbi:MAG: glycosyltransferase family 2 protein [Pseudobutyrivibrio sp.]|nr:glycosyltransferase family 2 protein [Pseudobutyrivibrio sp.]